MSWKFEKKCQIYVHFEFWKSVIEFVISDPENPFVQNFKKKNLNNFVTNEFFQKYRFFSYLVIYKTFTINIYVYSTFLLFYF